MGVDDMRLIGHLADRESPGRTAHSRGEAGCRRLADDLREVIVDEADVVRVPVAEIRHRENSGVWKPRDGSRKKKRVATELTQFFAGDQSTGAAIRCLQDRQIAAGTFDSIRTDENKVGTGGNGFYSAVEVAGPDGLSATKPVAVDGLSLESGYQAIVVRPYEKHY